MTVVKYPGRLLSASREDRILSYLLLPYGEEGRTNIGRLTVDAGVVALPDDPSSVVLNLEHDPTRPLGRGLHFEEASRGLEASFRIAHTRAGDDLLEESSEGLRTGVSVEIEAPVIRGGRLVAGALCGAGAVVSPAFPSAQLAASDFGEWPDIQEESMETKTVTSETVVIDGVEYVRKSASTHTEEVAPTDPVDAPTEQAAETADEASADDLSAEETEALVPEETEDNEGDEPEKEEKMSETIQAAAATVPTGSIVTKVPTKDPALRDVVNMMAAAFRSGGERKMLAALSDVVPADVDEMSQPGWLGELWSGVAYRRRFIPLFDNKPLTNYEMKGWRWTTKPTVAAYDGSKADVPSATVATESVTVSAQRLAGAHDIDRKFRDFGDTSFFEAYFRAMTESYARLSDIAVLDDVADAATVVDAGTVPTDVPAGLVYIVDGALEVIDLGTPSFAVVAKDLYRDILLTTQDNVLGYLNAALGFEEGTLQGNGFRIVGTDQLTAGSVLVGIRDAVTVHELSGVPIRVEAEDIAKGGIDEGVFGYYAVNIHDADGLALVSETGSVSA